MSCHTPLFHQNSILLFHQVLALSLLFSSVFSLHHLYRRLSFSAPLFLPVSLEGASRKEKGSAPVLALSRNRKTATNPVFKPFAAPPLEGGRTIEEGKILPPCSLEWQEKSRKKRDKKRPACRNCSDRKVHYLLLYPSPLLLGRWKNDFRFSRGEECQATKR